jgi:hypothetical protein
LKYGVVDSLDDVTDDKKEGWIYFVPSTNPDTENVYDEFIWADDNWEQIGSTAVTIPPPPAAGELLELTNNTYNVKSSKVIEDNADTVPTTKAVFDLFNKNKETVSPDKIFDLNQFIVNHIKTHPDDTDDWVRTLV